MSLPKDSKLSLKVLINKQKTKVLYAEAVSDFTDVLLSFHTLPLGTIVRILGKHYGGEAPVLGSLITLYNGLANLDQGLFWTECGKQLLLNPISSSATECCKLKINIDDSQPTKYLKCNGCLSTIVSMNYSTLKCNCGRPMNTELHIKDSKTGGANNGVGGIFVRSKASFIITDDLQVLPNVTGYTIRILSNLGITDTDGTELRILTFGFDEMGIGTIKCETGTLLGDQIENQTISGKKMSVKAIFQKSTRKFLFAEVDEDFVDFLFSLFTVPLGGVECLLGGSTSGLKNIDNLYWSIANINGDKYFKTKDTKAQLLKTKVPLCYKSEKQILSLNKEETPVLYYYYARGGGYTIHRGAYLSPRSSDDAPCGVQVSFKLPDYSGKYVKGPTMYMVTDDLTVMPLCSASGLSLLNALKIPLSDVGELALFIGSEEARSVLKASLISTCALTDGLINPILKKQQKQVR